MFLHQNHNLHLLVVKTCYFSSFIIQMKREPQLQMSSPRICPVIQYMFCKRSLDILCGSKVQVSLFTLYS